MNMIMMMRTKQMLLKKKMMMMMVLMQSFGDFNQLAVATNGQLKGPPDLATGDN